MTVYDAAMVGVIVAGMIWGLFRGIVWQIASIASLFLGYFGSHTISAQIVDYFPGEPVVARSLAMISGYVGISAGVFLMAWLVRASLKKMKFEAFDKHLGMLLGGVEGALLGIVVTLFVVSLAPNTRQPIFSSPSGKIVVSVMSAVGPDLPAEARQVLKPFWSSSTENEVAGSPIAPLPDLPPRGAKAAPAEGSGSSSASASDPATLTDLIEEGKAKLGKAIADQADAQIRKTTKTITDTLNQATGGISSNGSGGTIERR